MPLFRPQELHAFLKEVGAAPQKRLSQNFLIDGNVLRKIVELSGVQAGDLVLEIGPGPGVLTEALLAQGAQVVAVEKDRLFARALARLGDPSCLTVHEADALDWDLDQGIGRRGQVVANLPYHITTPLLERVLPRHDLFTTLTLLVQEEFARRLVAQPGGGDYSSLTLFTRFYSTPHWGFKVSPSCFYPKPTVSSALVHLELRPPPTSNPHFFPLVRTAFCQRRKMLTTSLSGLYPEERIREALRAIGRKEQVRPEELSLEEFLQVSNFLTDYALPLR